MCVYRNDCNRVGCPCALVDHEERNQNVAKSLRQELAEDEKDMMQQKER